MIWQSKRSMLFQGIYVTEKSIEPLCTHDTEIAPKARAREKVLFTVWIAIPATH